ncbi:MAG: DUF177 domain-containing protein [Tenericutes bacterium]|nr:DUF177 domain-containing protein [Mycoplasmatota bacterium]
MKIEIISLLNYNQDSIIIKELISFEPNAFLNTDIKSLNEINIEGYLTKDYKNNLILNIKIKGEMIILDSVTNEDIIYPFTINVVDETIEINNNNQNSLEIMPILWENIILEVPSRYTKSCGTINLQGNGWRLINEEDLNKGKNPFNILKEMEGDDKNGSTF